MSTLTSLLTRPSTLGALAVAGSGAFYVGLKYRTLTGPDGSPQAGIGNRSAEAGEGKGIRKARVEGKSYEVKPGREGGGV